MAEPSFVTKDEQAAKIFDWAAGAAALRMAYYGLKLGLFQAIASEDGGLTPDDLVARTELDARYVRAWARTSVASELLEYDAASGRLTLAAFMEALLLDDADFQYSAGLVTNFAVESRLADRVGDCFTSGEGIPKLE